VVTARRAVANSLLAKLWPAPRVNGKSGVLIVARVTPPTSEESTMRLSSLLTALLIAAAPGLASAAEVDSTKRIDKRQDAQEERIKEGRKEGDLTKQERQRLEKGQARVDAAEKKAAADGKVTAKERERLEKMQDHQSKRIEKQRTDENKK
jgi:septal ring factor EnvC (AmiA/AmiB activator)